MLGCLLAVTAVDCKPTQTEIFRATSPDQIVDVVVVEENVNATVATPVLVYIVPSGSKTLDDPVLRGDYFSGLKVTWNGPKVLEIHYSKARIFNFTNFWESKNVDDFHYVVAVQLKPT